MFGRCHHRRGRVRSGTQGEPDLGGHHPRRRALDMGPFEPAVGQRRGQGGRALLTERHLQVLPGDHRCDRIAQSPDEIGHHESPEIPIISEDFGQQARILPGPGSVHRVVGTHHAVSAGLHHRTEMRQIHLTQHVLGHPDVDPESGLLHGVQGEVFDAGHQPRARALDCCSTHGAQQQGVLAIGLLGPSPTGGIGEVDAHAGPQVGAPGPSLHTDGTGDFALQIGIPRRGAGDRDRERGRRPQCHTPGTVGETDPRDAETVDAAGLEGHLVVALRHVPQAAPDGQIPIK